MTADYGAFVTGFIRSMEAICRVVRHLGTSASKSSRLNHVKLRVYTQEYAASTSEVKSSSGLLHLRIRCYDCA